ncbi:MAG: class III extradiol ring-cleavage dioxygenase [Holophagaceae bacterium]
MRAPVLFVSHGSPMLALATEHPYGRALKAFADGLPERPKAVVAVSAHWQTRGGVQATMQARPETIHDFGGFPRELYEVQYPCPGDPALASKALDLAAAAGFTAAPEAVRGLDHGTWAVTRHLYPEADVPIAQVSLPELPPADLFRLGVALRPLRDEGVLILGSGGLVHNFRTMDWNAEFAEPDAWAVADEAWIMDRVQARRFDELLAYRETWPEARRVAPTTDHFDPLFVALGASEAGETPKDMFVGMQFRNMSLRSFAFGA